MSLASKEKARTDRVSAVQPLAAAWRRLTRPTHHGAVHSFRIAAEGADTARLTSLLDPGIAVVVDSGDSEQPTIRVVRGVADSVALLIRGMAASPGIVIEELAVNGQAGLMLGRGSETTAVINVDFTGSRISSVWIRLRPVRLRHWNQVY